MLQTFKNVLALIAAKLLTSFIYTSRRCFFFFCEWLLYRNIEQFLSI